MPNDEDMTDEERLDAICEQDRIDGKTAEDVLVEEIMNLVNAGYELGFTDEDVERLIRRVQDAIAVRNRSKLKLL